MLPAREVLRQVSGALQDLEPATQARWPWEGGEEDRIGLLDFLNAALRAVALQRPDCRAVTESIRLERGMRQRLPLKRTNRSSHNAVGFCELVRNMGEDGETPGRAIISVQPDVLLAWAEHTPAGGPCAGIDNFAYDRATNGQVYYVYPPVSDCRDVWVEATYYAALDMITSPDQCIGIDDAYAQALVHHMLAAILSGDNETAASQAGKAVYHQQMYQQCLGIKSQVDVTWPKAKNSVRGGGE